MGRFNGLEVFSNTRFIAKLLAAVLHLDPAFVDERIEAVVEPAGAGAELAGDLALRQVGVVLQHAQHPVVGVFLQLGSAGGHGGGGACAVLWAGYRSVRVGGDTHTRGRSGAERLCETARF